MPDPSGPKPDRGLGTAVTVEPGRARVLTFAFTDIEGSTRLLAHLRERYADLLAEHADVIRAAASAWHGSVVDTQGDSFFLVFDHAAEALSFAIDVERQLAEHGWPEGVEVRVRIGLHTGRAQVSRTGYVGLDVHRAARIAGAAHGGQVVISAATRAAIAVEPPGVGLRDLGPHRLKDLPEPERIYQIEATGLAVEFPPLRSLDAPDEPPAAGEAPYQGLETFDVENAGRFFGRERLTSELIDDLRRRDFLAIVGASGSGKSSLVRAGLAAALQADGDRRRDEKWAVQVITPTDRPLATLDAALTAASSRQPNLLIVDQLEELFSLCDRPADRAAFVIRLLAWLGSQPRGAKVAVTLRADFYDRLVDLPALRDAVAADQRYIGPMSAAELRAAIEAPARAGDWAFDAGLVDLILHDIGREPGALPLLSHALLETWNRRRGRTMTLKGYGEAGGVSGAIARTADRVVLDEAPDRQAIARSIFMRLVEASDDGRDTRRRAGLQELVPLGADQAAVKAVLDALAAARLVTIGDGWAEIAHEALIDEWPALREWLDEDREGRALQRRLTEAAREWSGLSRDPSLLARGPRLARLAEWARAHRDKLNSDEAAFVEASAELEQSERAEREAQRERELEAARALADTERRAATRLRRRAAVLVVALAVAVGALGAAVWQAAEAQRQAAVARSRELTASAVAALDADPSLAKLLALQAVDLVDTPSAETIGVLHQAWAADPVIYRHSWQRGAFGPHAGTADISPDGSRYVEGGVLGFEVIDQEGGEVVWSDTAAPHTWRSPALYTPDGQWLVTGAAPDPTDDIAPAASDLGVFVWDAATGALVRHFTAGGDCGTLTFAVSLRSVLVFTAAAEPICFAGSIGLALVDLQTGQLRSLTADGGGFFSAEHGALSADGRYVAYDEGVSGGDAHSVVLDTTSGEAILDLPHSSVVGQEDTHVRDISDDGRYLLLGDRPIKTIDVQTGGAVAQIGGASGAVTHAEFSSVRVGAALGLRYPVMTNGRDGYLRLWDGLSGSELMSVPAIGSGTFSATSTGLTLAQSFDNSQPDGAVPDVAILDLGVRGELGGVDGRALGSFAAGSDRSRGECLAPAGGLAAGPAQLIYGDYCGPVFAEYTTQMVELSSDGPRLRNSLLGAGSAAMAISPDARSFVRAEAAEPMVTGIAVRDSVTGDVLVNLAGMCEWDASAALQEQACPTYPGQPFGLDPSRLRWSPDGSMVAAAEWWGGDFTSFYAVWDAHTGRLLTDGRSAVATQDVIFSPDSDRLISVHEDGNGGLRLESVSTSDWHVAVSAPFNSASDLALIGYTAGSGTLVGVSELLSDQAGTAALHWFDARTLEETRQPTEKIHDGSVKAVAMSPSGNFVASGASDGTVRIWDAASGQLVHEIGTGSAEAQGVAFLDDSRLAVVVRDGSLRLYAIDDAGLVDVVRNSLTRAFTSTECERYGIEPCPTIDELRAQ